jgi:hypothetical protein
MEGYKSLTLLNCYRKTPDVLNVQAPRVVGNRSGPPVFSPKWDNYDVMKHRY